ncbi:MAG: hypothetical protein R3D33_00475 [Hyphomicrobiaceae bacterium]
MEMVAGSELTGRASVIRLGLLAQVKIIRRPLAILTLHVIVPKTHPNARTLLYYVNDALKRLKEAGDYDKIVEKHLTLFWEIAGRGRAGAGADRRDRRRARQRLPPAPTPPRRPGGGSRQDASGAGRARDHHRPARSHAVLHFVRSAVAGDCETAAGSCKPSAGESPRGEHSCLLWRPLSPRPARRARAGHQRGR